jgi:hypothetical protein
MINDMKNARKNKIARKQGLSDSHAKEGARLPVKVTRSHVNYIVDLAILVSAAMSVLTGIIKWPGLAYTLGMSYESLPMEAITFVHDWTGLITGILALAHLALHWRWLMAMTGKIMRAGRVAK